MTTALVALAASVVSAFEMAVGPATTTSPSRGQLQTMTSMRADCPADCIERLRQDTWWLQLRAVALGAVLLLVTNLGAVAWVTMFRGGRLDARAVCARP